MNSVRFIGNDKLEKQFVIKLRKNVNDYFKQNNISTKANFAMVFKTIVLISMYIVPYILILIITMPTLIAFLLVLLMGIGVAGVGIPVAIKNNPL